MPWMIVGKFIFANLKWFALGTLAIGIYWKASGWVNDYSSEELEAIFSKHGFDCEFKTDWRHQKIYRFCVAGRR